jgi:hypothetical protein
MGHQLGLVVVTLALYACAEEGPKEISAANPHHQCREQGIAFGTEAFDECIETLIAQRCTSAGHAAKSPGYSQCVESFRRTVFLTQQLEIRGYRLFKETN